MEKRWRAGRKRRRRHFEGGRGRRGLVCEGGNPPDRSASPDGDRGWVAREAVWRLSGLLRGLLGLGRSGLGER